MDESKEAWSDKTHEDLLRLSMDANNALVEILSCVDDADDIRVTATFPVVSLFGSHWRAMLRLSSWRNAHAMYTNSRTAFESCVNILFVLRSKKEVAERSISHCKQKIHRDLDRRIEIAGHVAEVKWSGLDEFEMSDDVKIALKQFTSKSGTEIRRWTPESLFRRIDIAAGSNDFAKYFLFLGYAVIYRQSSEVAHGTLFGAIYPMGATEPRPREQCVEDKALDFIRTNEIVILWVVLGLSLALVDAFGELVGRKKVRDVRKRLADILAEANKTMGIKQRSE